MRRVYFMNWVEMDYVYCRTWDECPENFFYACKINDDETKKKEDHQVRD